MTDQSTIQFFTEVPETSITEVFELLDQTAKNLRRIQRLTVRKSGLTPPQYQVLYILWDRDELPLKDLASACSCTRATITGLVDGLERKGLVIRKLNPDDRRSLLATLTDEGRALQSQTPELEKVYEQCCSGLTSHEFRQLGLLLSRLNKSLIY
jgi:DNA-binding MarR family transcriptional regulator